jgi:hypothetical protein
MHMTLPPGCHPVCRPAWRAKFHLASEHGIRRSDGKINVEVPGHLHRHSRRRPGERGVSMTRPTMVGIAGIPPLTTTIDDCVPPGPTVPAKHPQVKVVLR